MTPQQIAEFNKNIQKDWGNTVVLGDKISEYDGGRRSISTGSSKLDWALTLPLVEGTVNEVHGKNGCGKTTLALEIAANATLMGKPVYYFDLERKLVDSQIGMIPRLKRELFTRIRPDNGEDAVNKVHRCVTEMPGCVVIFDSLTQMLPEVEDASGAQDQQMGLVARLAAKMIRKILGPVERNRCMVLFISHETANMDMYSGGVKTKGGNAVPDAAAQRIQMKALSAGKIKENGHIVGQNVTCKVVKNNQGLPFREVQVPLIYGQGIDRARDLFQVCVDLCLIEKNGGWYTMDLEDGPKRVQGAESVINEIKSNKPYRKKLRESLTDML